MPKGQRGRGRPTKIDAVVSKAITDAIEKGVPFKYACEAAGIAERTGHEWVQRGEAGDEDFSAFSAAVTRARAKLVGRMVVAAVKDGPSGARWLLERRFSKDFGSKQTLEHSGPDGGPIVFDKPVREMSDEELERLANARNGK